MSCRYDNAAVVAIVNSGRSRLDRAMHLRRCLSFFLARWDMMFVCSHIPGTDNCAADALSRNSLSSFQSLVPEAEADPTPIHEDLLQCLVHDTPDWTKVDWVALFRTGLGGPWWNGWSQGGLGGPVPWVGFLLPSGASPSPLLWWWLGKLVVPPLAELKGLAPPH